MITLFSKNFSKQLHFCLLFLFFINFGAAQAQQSVSIGATEIKTNAVLYLKGTGNQGLIIPIVTSNGSFGESGMMVYNSTDKKLYYHNGTSWVEASGSTLTEVDGIIGNEVTSINSTRGGLELTGSGTNASPLSVGLIPGTVDGQILKWDNTNKKWILGTDATTTLTAGTGINIVGTTITNTGDTNAADDITTATTATGDLAGTFPNLTVAKIRGVNVVATAPTANQVLQYNGTNWVPTTLTAGTVSSVALAMPSIFSVAGSPITTSGTFSTTLASQTAATVFAAPTAAAGTPTFRTLAATDIPALDAAKITTGTFPLTKITGAGAGTRAILGSDNNTVSWVTGAPNQLLGTDGAGALSFANKSNFTFTTDNTIPKGSAGGLIASQIFDDGTNVGIGTTTPAYKLDVFSTAQIRPLIVGSAPYKGTSWFSLQHQALPLNDISYAFAQHKGGYTLINTPSNAGSNFIDFRVDDVSKMTLLENGNVGIGTAAPGYLLDVNKTLAGVGDANMRVYNPSNNDGDNSGIRFGVGSFWAVHLQTALNGNWLELTDNSGTPVHSWGYNTYHPGNFSGYLEGGSGRLSLMSANVGIGTVSPAQALDVVGNIQTSGYYYYSDGTYIFHVPGSYTGINDHWIPNNVNLYDLGHPTWRWRNVYLTNSPNVSSDSRLKKDITDLNYGLAEVLKLRPVSYKLIADEEQKTKLGLIAQEVRQIIPEIVTEDNSKEKYLGMSYSELIPVLINAIQEHEKTIEKLKAEIVSIQQKNNSETGEIKAELAEIKKMLNIEASKK
jgi:hypothetical protein